MRCFGIRKVLLCLLASSWLASNAIADMTTITVHENSAVKEEMIRLGSISDIRGDDPSVNQMLKSIVIGRSPLPGKSRHIDQEYINVRLRQNKVDLSRVSVRCPERIKVSRDYLKIRKAEIRKVVVDYINDRIPWDRESVRIKRVNVPSDVVLPKGDLVYEVVPLKHWNFVGRTSIPVIFRVNQKFQKKIWVTVEVEVFTEVVVSSRPLERFRIVSREDVSLVRRNLANLSKNVINRLEDVIGKRTKRSIDTNMVMTAHMLDLPPVVKRGDLVTILFETPVLKVTARGEVRKKGLKGDTVKVLNIMSRKEVYGTVLDPNTVKVEF